MGKFSNSALDVGLLALSLLIDFLKGKTKKYLWNNNRPGRDVGQINA